MPKPNYSYEKRQREIAKKKKQDEKQAKKAAGRNTAPSEEGAPAAQDVAGRPDKE